MKINQLKTGVVISYALIILNALYGLFLTPYIIGNLGMDDYGVYKIMTALTSSLLVMDLGIGGTVLRYVAKYKAQKQNDRIPNFMAMNLIQVGMLCVVIFIVSIIVFQLIGPMYSNTFTYAQLSTAKLMFMILVVNLIFHVMTNFINGFINGNNRFAFGNGIMLVRLIIRIILVWAMLIFFKSALTLVLIDFAVTVVFFVVELIYAKFKLDLRIKFTHWEKSVFLEGGKYTILMFLTSIASQVENSLDNVIIGAISGPALVTVYSIGLTIFSMYVNLSTSISGVMLPTVTNLLEEENADTKIQRLIVQAGRYQFLLLGAAAVGFICIGKDFIRLWMGEGFEDVYIITLILMIPSLFELCVNVSLAILRAKNMLTFRTLTLFATTVLNAVITVLLVKYWSYIGAAIGTAASYIIGSLIVMNIYFTKKLHLPMLKIYKNIFSKIWICLLIAGIALYAFSRIVYGSWIAVFIDIIVFCIAYGATLLLFGLSKSEKTQIPILRRFIKTE